MTTVQVLGSQKLDFYIWAFRTALVPGRRFIVWQVFDAVIRGIEPIAQVFLAANFISELAKLISKEGGVESSAFFWLGLMAALTIFSIIFRRLNALVNSKYEFLLQLFVEQSLTEKVYALSQPQFDEELFNQKLSKAMMGKDSVIDILRKFLDIISSSFGFFISIITITVKAPIVGFVMIVALLPLLIVQIKINHRRDNDETQNDKDWRIMSRTGWVLTDPTRMPEIRLLGSYTKLIEIWKYHKERIFNKELQTTKVSVVSLSLAESVSLAGELFSNIWFLGMAISGALSLEAFLFLRGLLQQSTSSGNTLASTIQSVHKNFIEVKNLRVILESKPLILDGTVELPSSESLHIQFKNVCFHYPNEKKALLNNVSFDIKSDSRIALVGKNGAGKSTILKLLLRQYLPTSGQILINGRDIKTLEINSFYDRISTLMQNFSLIEHLSIAENIRLGTNKALSIDDIREASKKAGADNFINKLRHGYDQRMLNVYEDGSELSGGESQRISLARALVRQSDLLILDEPTSAIDAKGEMEFFNNVFDGHRGKATVIVSHRFSTVRTADIIIVLDEGAIIDFGSHAELMQRGGLYKEMFDIQAEGYK
ncbi:ABC transporter ATP-binding protein [Polynucleobacter sp.]|uniref:ABC transporter ATP-binding protein n=1 Tax=Polynucleobacter sp. TaxID=2029855 RepID=UPI0027331561|nr:ABC transporter ATP-binding protein [Polynucleobacter sp.]MDP3121249.1 ABC transporter ATP-binding protein [Polynucleobacter sp.]